MRLTLVTGSSGNVGGPLLDALRERNVAAIGAHQTASHTDDQGRLLDFLLPSTFPAALEGIDRVFLMRPPPISDTKRYIRPFIEAMVAAQVQHVVFLSLMGVNRVMPHWRIEQDLRDSGLGWTMLRPAFFAQNLGAAYLADIRDHDRIRLASGNGRTSFIDTRDIADVAALALESPLEHRGKTYTLTGPHAIDYHEVASRLSASLARPIRYEPIGLLRYRRELLAAGSPPDYVRVQLLINIIAKLGMAAKVNNEVPRLLHRPSRTLQTYIDDHRHLFTRSSRAAS